MNFTQYDLLINASAYVPSDACFDWCVPQHLKHSYNLETNLVILVAFAFIMIVLYFMAHESEHFDKYKHGFLYIARISLLIFLASYFLIVKWRII